MKMKDTRYIVLLTLGLCFVGQMCWAETKYVTDSFKITMRTGPSLQNKIIIMIQSGEPLDIIETKDDWSHVRALKRQGDESEGWVMSRYLITRQPWADQTKSLKRENAQLKEKLARIEKEWRETGGREKEASKGLKETRYKFHVLQKRYDELKKGSSNYVKLKEDYDSTRAALDTSKKDVNRLTNENELLRASQRNKWLGMGALILLCGLIVGISMGKFQKKQKSSVRY